MSDQPLEHDDARMSLGEHLEELRYRLILGLIGPVIFAVGLMFIAWDVVEIICQPLLYELNKNNIDATLYNQGVSSAFLVYLKVSLIGGLLIGVPWLFYQLWLFIAPGLLPPEKRFVRRLIPFRSSRMIHRITPAIRATRTSSPA